MNTAPQRELSDWSSAPLFAAHRRRADTHETSSTNAGPPVAGTPQPASVPEPAAIPPDVKLVGTVALAGQRLAVIALAAQAQPSVVREGETLDAWSVSAIDGTTFELRSSDDARVKFGFSQEQAARERLTRTAPSPNAAAPSSAFAAPPASGAMPPGSIPPPAGAGVTPAMPATP